MECIIRDNANEKAFYIGNRLESLLPEVEFFIPPEAEASGGDFF